MSTLLDLWVFLRVRKKYWLIPVCVLLIAIVGLLILAQGSIIAPFIYTLF